VDESLQALTRNKQQDSTPLIS